MGFRALAGFAAVATAAFASAGCQTQPVRDARVVVEPAVVSIVGRRQDSRQGGGGTGFFIAPGQVVTCRHVVETYTDVLVRLADGRQVPVQGVLADDHAHDLVLLAVATPDVVAPLAFASAPPRTGDPARVVGSPRLRAQTVLPGFAVGGEVPHEECGTVQWFTGNVGFGASGAPVLDAEGRVLGVTARGGDWSGAWAAVPARFARALVAGPVKPMPVWGTETASDPTVAAWHGFNEAAFRFLEEDWAEAAKQAEAVLAQRGAWTRYHAKACSTLRRSLVKGHKSEQALTRLQALRKERPEEAWSHGETGWCLFGMKRTEEAVAAFTEAKRLAPSDVEWSMALGKAHVALQHLDPTFRTRRRACR